MNIKKKLRCWFIAAGSLHHEPMVTFRLPVDRFNWTLPDGPPTHGPRGPIGRISARCPSVSLSPVTSPTSYRYRCLGVRPSVCLTADGHIITVGRNTHMDLRPRGRQQSPSAKTSGKLEQTGSKLHRLQKQRK